MDTLPQDQIYIAGITLMQMISEHLGRSTMGLTVFRIANCIVFSLLTVLNFVNYFYIDDTMFIKNAETSVVVVHVSKQIFHLH